MRSFIIRPFGLGLAIKSPVFPTLNKTKMYSIIKKPSCYSEYGFQKKAYFTPYLFVRDGKEFFIRNLVEFTKGDKKTKNRNELSNYLLDLRKNKFKFITSYCYSRHEDPISFLKWVIETKKTFQITGELFYCFDGYADFHGNLKEVSCAFNFRIYDKELLRKTELLAKKCRGYREGRENV